MDYYDRQGNPITMMDWAKTERAKDKRVALDEVEEAGKTYQISTVWLGIDHQFGDGPPLIFETMVFPGDSYEDLACERYSTEADAVAGHAQMVARVRAGQL